jgi:DNA-directed RNA polymerase
MQGVLNSINHMESTEWVINEPMLRFVKNAARVGHPEIPLASAGDKVMFKIDMQVADLLVGQTFRVEKDFDFRGRVYSTASFHYGRGDYIRSLFQIANGKPLDADGLRWLKIYVCTAAAGQHHKPGNMKLEERERWADERLATLVDLGRVVFEGREVGDNEPLKKVGDPFQFIAACVELYQAHAKGPGFISRLPVSLDATCSGLQIISALTRSEVEGHLVNLTPDASPQDFYRLIADTTKTLVEKDAVAASRIKSKFKPPKVSVWLLYSVTAARPDLGAPWVFCLLSWLFYGDLRLYARILTVPGLVSFDRDRMKTPVMTHFYSAEPFGVAQRLQKDKKLPPLPLRARYYLAKKIREAIKIKAPRCSKFMDFLKKIERLLASEGKFLQMALPDGFPFENSYPEPKIKTMEFYVNGRRASCEVAIGDLPDIRKGKAVRSVCPNLVHALDAYHVRLFALGARDANIAVATNHDCFIGLAADATRIREIALDRFASIYEDRDILSEILALAKRALTPANRRKLPKLPKYGTLNIGDVRNAQYAIS